MFLLIFVFLILIVYHFSYHNATDIEKAFWDKQPEKAVQLFEEKFVYSKEKPTTKTERLKRIKEISEGWKSFSFFLKDYNKKNELLSLEKLELYNSIITKKIESLQSLQKKEKYNYNNYNELDNEYEAEAERELAREVDPHMGMSEDEFYDWWDSKNDN
ncbi:MAG: hypothetical protein RSB50_09245 [Cetobacterium sp.]